MVSASQSCRVSTSLCTTKATHVPCSFPPWCSLWPDHLYQTLHPSLQAAWPTYMLYNVYVQPYNGITIAVSKDDQVDRATQHKQCTLLHAFTHMHVHVYVHVVHMHVYMYIHDIHLLFCFLFFLLNISHSSDPVSRTLTSLRWSKCPHITIDTGSNTCNWWYTHVLYCTILCYVQYYGQ